MHATKAVVRQGLQEIGRGTPAQVAGTATGISRSHLPKVAEYLDELVADGEAEKRGPDIYIYVPPEQRASNILAGIVHTADDVDGLIGQLRAEYGKWNGPGADTFAPAVRFFNNHDPVMLTRDDKEQLMGALLKLYWTDPKARPYLEALGVAPATLDSMVKP